MSTRSPLGQSWLFPAKMKLSEPKTGHLPFQPLPAPPVATAEALGNDKNCLKRDAGENVAFHFSVVFADLSFEMILLSLALVLFLLSQKKLCKKAVFSSSNKTQWIDLNPEEDRMWSFLAFLCIFSGRDEQCQRLPGFQDCFSARSLTPGDAASLGQHLPLWPCPPHPPLFLQAFISCLEKLSGLQLGVVFSWRSIWCHFKAKLLLESVSLQGVSAVAALWVLFLCSCFCSCSACGDPGSVTCPCFAAVVAGEVPSTRAGG